jgi:hypothetical protein
MQPLRTVDQRVELCAGIASIASAGVPGPLATIGERARVLVVGEHDGSELPVVVSTQWNDGRVIAFGHGGMLGERALRHEGTRVFVPRCVEWLAGDGPKGEPRVVVVRENGALAELLRETGWTVREVGSDALDETSLRGASVLCVDAHSIRERDREGVRAFVRGGGGLLTAGLGWGWLQLNPGKTIHDHPGNTLLAEAGIVWCDGTLETTAPESFAMRESSLHACAATALATLERTLAASEDAKPAVVFDAQAGAAVMQAARAAPRGHAFAVRCDALLEREATSSLVRPVISEKAPLRASNAVGRVMVALDVDRERQTPAALVRAHPSHDEFPGPVLAAAPRVEATIAVQGAKRWESTGLYVPAGEVVTLRLVKADDSAAARKAGLRVRIGAHSDELWHHASWKRVPDVQREFAWGDGTQLEVASAFGGLLYVECGALAQGTIALVVGGAVRSPLFVLGKTSEQEWALQRQHPAPWAELASEKVIVTVPSEFVRGLAAPDEVMRMWDAISDAHAELATIDKQPAFAHRFVADVQISAGYMHAGYPIMTHLDAAAFMTDVSTLRRGSWGLLHELGHNHQEDAWTFDGTVEVTCNLFTLHAIDTVCDPEPGDRGHDAVNTPPNVEKHLALGAQFERWKQDPFLALHMYVQLERAFGWETYKKVFAEYRTLPRAELPRSDDEKRDQWMVRFSRACGKNLGPFFVRWGVPTSEAARASIADLPAWMPPEWAE